MVNILLDNRDECEVVKALESFSEDAFQDESNKSTELFKFIEERKWKQCTDRLRGHREEASAWSFPDGYAGDETHYRLPIHEACRHCPPKDVIIALIEAFPGGVKSKDFNGRLPIHHACIWGAESDIVRLLLRVYPASTDEKDRWGNTPVDALQATDSPDTAVMDLLIGVKKDVKESPHSKSWRPKNHPEIPTRSLKLKGVLSEVDVKSPTKPQFFFADPRNPRSPAPVATPVATERTARPASNHDKSEDVAIMQHRLPTSVASPAATPVAKEGTARSVSNDDKNGENVSMQHFAALKSAYIAKQKSYVEEISVLSAKCSIMEREVAQMDGLKEKIEALEGSATEWENVIAERDGFILELKQQVSEQKLARLKSTQELYRENVEMQDELSELRIKCEVSNNEIVKLKEAHTKDHINLCTMEDEKTALKDQISVLEATKTSLKTRLQKSEEGKKKLIDELQETNTVMDEDTKKKLIVENDDEKEKLLQDFEKWKTSFEEEKDKMKAEKMREKEEIIKERDTQKIAFEEEREKLMAEYDEATSKLRHERDTLEASLCEANGNLSSSLEIIAQLKDVLARKDAPLLDEIEAAKEEIQTLKDEKEQLVKMLNEKEDEVLELKVVAEKNVALQDEVEALKCTISTQEKELRLKEEELSKMEQEVELYQQGKEALHDLLKGKEDEVESLERRNVDLLKEKEDEVETLERQNVDLKARYTEEIDHLKDDLDKSVDANVVHRLQAKIEVLESKVEWMQPRLTDEGKTIYAMKTFGEETPKVFSRQSPPSSTTLVAPQARKSVSIPRSVANNPDDKTMDGDNHDHEAEEGDNCIESRFLQWLDDRK